MKKLNQIKRETLLKIGEAYEYDVMFCCDGRIKMIDAQSYYDEGFTSYANIDEALLACVDKLSTSDEYRVKNGDEAIWTDTIEFITYACATIDAERFVEKMCTLHNYDWKVFANGKILVLDMSNPLEESELLSYPSVYEFMLETKFLMKKNNVEREGEGLQPNFEFEYNYINYMGNKKYELYAKQL